MSKNKIVALTFVVLVAITTIYLTQVDKEEIEEKQQVDNYSEIVLYSTASCPFCGLVKNYIDENDLRSKIDFNEKDVSRDSAAGRELVDKARICGIPENQIGVPFLWDGEGCVTGYDEIIKFFDDFEN